MYNFKMKNLKLIILSLFLLLSFLGHKAEAVVSLQLSALDISGTSTYPSMNVVINAALTDFTSNSSFGLVVYNWDSTVAGTAFVLPQTNQTTQTKIVAIQTPLTNGTMYYARAYYTDGASPNFIFSNQVSFKFGDPSSVNNAYAPASVGTVPTSANNFTPVVLPGGPNPGSNGGNGDWYHYKKNSTGGMGDLSLSYKTISECETERAKGNSYSKQCFQFYYPLAPLPGQADKIDTTTSGDSDCPFGNYLNILIKLFIGICAVLAMIKIVLGGMQYMTSELSSGKEDGKNSITSAVFGLILALGAFAILNTINPELLKVCLNNLPKAVVMVENEPETGIDSDSTGKATINLIKKSDNSIVSLTNCDTTQMVTVNAFGTSMQVYKGLKPSLERINQQWLAHPASDRYKIKTVYAYNCRKVRNKPNAWSSHAFGLALDINPQENPYGNTLKTDMPLWFKQLFINEGWGWGGDWVNVKDAMHFSKYPPSENGDKKIEI